MKIEHVTVMMTGEMWFAQLKRGLGRIDDALAAEGADICQVDALAAWTADPVAFALVIHALVGLGIPVAPELLALAGIPTPPPGIGNDGARA